jgi:prepilin-type N-terminal cleavage/methylation domain-containing protein/prepilin-type processing-associated H-X9-DG protein
MRQRSGFTLIELLVVIAIIAILAAMLFPVFARARESARKIQCLSNVKNIAMAVQIYLTDYDRFPPSEHRAEINSWAKDRAPCCCADRISSMNPYLKWPVIFDEYVKNRDVWRCPSSRFGYGSTINSANAPGANGDWWKEYHDNVDTCPTPRPCSGPFPPGWGGTVTDTIVQGWDGCAGPDTGGFDWSIGTAPRWALDTKTGQMEDPAKYPVSYDAGPVVSGANRASWIAYPDTCRIDQCGNICNPSCGADWENCSWTQDCGAERGDIRWASDAQFRKDNAKSRHLGGSNIGFADGHATWMMSEQILWSAEDWSGYGNDANLLLGIGVCTVPVNQ